MSEIRPNTTAMGQGTGAPDCDLEGVAVPVSLLSDVDRFGGRVEGDVCVGTLHVRGGRAQGVTAGGAASRLVLPRLTEAHVHLDKCHTVERCAGVGGDLPAAIEAQRRDKVNWTAEDIAARAARGLGELERAGCGLVRSHVDWLGGAEAKDAPIAWEVLKDLRSGASERGVDLQLACLVGPEEMADLEIGAAVARRMAQDGGVLGVFLYDQPVRLDALRRTFALAEQYGLALDFHVDEGLDPKLDGLEMVADVALESGFEGPVLCGHACSLASLPHDDVARIAEKLARAGVAVAALPTTNLYLQGRNGGTPDRRGLTDLSALDTAGVTTVIGTDNVRDAFYPIGQHDPLQSLALAVAVAHLDPPLGRHLPTVSTGAARALGRAPVTVDGARAQDLLVCNAASVSEALTVGCARSAVLDVIKGDCDAR